MLINAEQIDKIDTKNYGDGSNNVFVIWTLSLKSSTKSECFKFLGFVHLQSVLVEISSSPEKYYKLRSHQERVMEGMMPEEPIAIDDTEWGCIHSQYHYQDKDPAIITCIVNINNTDLIATELVNSVLNTSWISSLDAGTQRSYKVTAKETTDALVEIFNKVLDGDPLGAEFGEVMVSIGSSRALSQILHHISLPIAELWKPQLKQNEGFDFHTTCTGNLINFGEAKFSASINPHGNAIRQAHDFITQDKHFRDRVHLVNLCHKDAIKNLDEEKYGIIAAFSINSDNPEIIMNNAVKTVMEIELLNRVSFIYLVGVKC